MRGLRRIALLVVLGSLVALAGASDKKSQLFDGKTFAGWEGDTKIFRIEEGAIVAGSLTEKTPRNEFLASEKEFGDFELTLEFKLEGDAGKGFVNSGVQIRSQRVPNSNEMSGYQADLGKGYWGSIYDESRRNKVVGAADQAVAEKAVKQGEWNTYRIRAEGKRIQTFINNVQTVDYTEKDDSIPQKGRFGLQIHGGGPARISFKNIMIEVL